MPELPEVETTCRGIAPVAVNHTIADVIIREHRLRWPIPRDLPQLLRNQRIEDISRRGKYILIHLTNGTVIIHLGMSGSLRIVTAEASIRKHDHFDIILDSGQHLRLHDPRRFGCVLFTDADPNSHFLLKDLGVEPLEREFNGQYLFDQSRHRSVATKLFIMNSHIVVGVGNIYASEALFLAGIHPKRKAGKLTQQQCIDLAKAIKQVLRASIKQGGTTLRDFVNGNGQPGYFSQKLRVYDRKGEPCVSCGQPIRHCILGQRATYYCATCQV